VTNCYGLRTDILQNSRVSLPMAVSKESLALSLSQCHSRWTKRKVIMLSKQDYRLMAEVFREVWFEYQRVIYVHDSWYMYIEILERFLDMLQKDNPKFNRWYFRNYIVYGTERPKIPQKSPSGEAQA
jgi:hypothetical protein